ncbi:MAG: winged helix-turn-helix domain-containing protein [Steroidobacteraceae bacterium]
MESTTTAEPNTAPTRYSVADLQVDVERRRVTRADRELPVGGISFEFFLVLVRAAPNLVTFDELMQRVWPGLVVNQETVTQRAKMIRRALGDDADKPRYISGVRGRGYCLIAPVVALGTPGAAQGMRAPNPIRRRWYFVASLLVGLLVLTLVAGKLRRDGASIGATTALTVVTPAVLAPARSVAVLPFVNLTGDPTKDYLGDGVAEEVINELGTLPGLKVPARTSSFAYKNRDVDIRQIAKDLGVATVLEGSVREASSRIRVTAQLINAQDGLHLWSASYDRKFTDLIKMQDDLATAIGQALSLRLNGASAIAYSPPTQNVEAYDLYLQGEALMDRPSPQTLPRTVDYFERALTLDPKFSRAYSGIGNAKLLLYVLFAQRPAENLAAAERAAQRALELDANSANSHETVAAVATVRGHWVEAEVHIRTALSLSPGDGTIHMVHGNMLRILGHLREALDEQMKAHALVPGSLGVSVNQAASYSILGRDADALKSVQLALDLGVSQALPPLSSVNELAAFRSGRFQDAAAAAAKSLDPANPDAARTAEVAKLVYGAMANPSLKATAVAARVRLYPRVSHPGSGFLASASVGPCLNSAYLYAVLRELDLAYGLANQCLDSMTPEPLGAGIGAETGDNTRLWAPELRPFREDRRFPTFVKRLGYMAYWESYGPPDDCDLKDGQMACR